MKKSEISTSSADIFALTAEPEILNAEDLSEPDEGMGTKFAQYLQACWQRRWLIVAIVSAGILLALLRALLLPATYTSIVTLMPPGNQSAYTGLMARVSGDNSAGMESEVLGMGTPSELFIGILQSRTVRDAMIKRFDLLNQFKNPSAESVRSTLATSTAIEEDRKSGIISISVSTISPTLAADLASGYVEELNDVVLADSTSSARRERLFLEERLKDVKQDLDTSASALSQFAVKNKTADVAAQTKSMVDEGMKMQAEVMEGRSQLAALRQIYSEDNFRIKEIEAHNAELQREMDAMGGRAKASDSQDTSTSSAYPTVGQLVQLGPTFADLERRLKVDEALWEALTKEYEGAKVEEARQIPTVRVLDAANIPTHKSGPMRTRILLVGFALSLLVACAVVLALSYWEELDSRSEPKRTITAMINSMRAPRQLEKSQ